MSKILVNNNSFDVEIADTGVTVAATSAYTIPPQDYATFAASSDVIKLLSTDPATLILNDGGVDVLVVSTAVDIIKGWPVQAPATMSEPFFFDYTFTISDDLPNTIFFSVVADQNLYLSRLNISCRIESFIEVKKNGEVIASLRTGAANPSASFHWSPNRKCLVGDSIEITLQKRINSPDVEVGAHLMGLSAP